ncbi:MAG: hypothetical protein PHG61_07260 [Candidatus Marinimicrobia bacterium]|nr:hypothetical protein [Candidatus Neomarinimicrobiota bacterium]
MSVILNEEIYKLIEQSLYKISEWACSVGILTQDSKLNDLADSIDDETIIIRERLKENIE